jgi:hypothetical protein
VWLTYVGLGVCIAYIVVILGPLTRIHIRSVMIFTVVTLFLDLVSLSLHSYIVHLEIPPHGWNNDNVPDHDTRSELLRVPSQHIFPGQ